MPQASDRNKIWKVRRWEGACKHTPCALPLPCLSAGCRWRVAASHRIARQYISFMYIVIDLLACHNAPVQTFWESFLKAGHRKRTKRDRNKPIESSARASRNPKKRKKDADLTAERPGFPRTRVRGKTVSICFFFVPSRVVPIGKGGRFGVSEVAFFFLVFFFSGAWFSM